MSHFDDDGGEMRATPLTDAEADALLRGRRDSADPALAEVVGALRALASGTAPTPSPELALLFEQGLTTDHSDLPATARSNAHGPATQAAGLPKWRRRTRMVTEILSGVVAKLAALGATAKAAVAVTAASATIVTSGAAGILPESVERAVDTAVPVDIGALDGGDDEALVDDEGGEALDDTEAEDGAESEGRPEQPGEAGQQGLERAAENEQAAERVPSTLGPDTGEEMRERNSQQPAEGTPEQADSGADNAEAGQARAPDNTDDNADDSGDDTADDGAAAGQERAASGADNAPSGDDSASDSDDAAAAGGEQAQAGQDQAQAQAGQDQAPEDTPGR